MDSKAVPDMSPKNRGSGEIAPLLLIFGALFLGLALLSAFLIAGESRRARILVEYEADRLASGLLDAFRSQSEVDPALFDPRILGFGIYRSDGALLAGFGEAPASIPPAQALSPFRYDEARKSLALSRPLGMGGFGAGEGRSMMQRMGRRGRGAGGLFYFSMGIGSYYRSRLLYKSASFMVPILIATLAAAFLWLLSSNLRFRRRAAERETLARLGESARTLAHEIRNPLGAIRLQTGLIRRKLGGEADRELGIIEEETERLNALTRRVGDFLRNPLGDPELVDLAEFLREIAGRSPYAIRLPEEPPPAFVLFDRELLRSVVENLARNAQESYGEARQGGEVEMELSREGARVILAVLDRGSGIDPELMDKVFDPFYTSKAQGSGIGLSLARRFVEAAGGSLSLGPRQGGGAEARITLPAGGSP
jgi:signal transduction histidine kinase